MKPMRSPNRRSIVLFFVASAVLFLGIVQWSFLPILIQNGPVGSAAVLEMSAGHSSKFAAPFKCPFKNLFGDGLGPCFVQSRITVQRIASRIPHPPIAPISGKDEFFLSYHPLRAPPSA
jgi:hypothetical protein